MWTKLMLNALLWTFIFSDIPLVNSNFEDIDGTFWVIDYFEICRISFEVNTNFGPYSPPNMIGRYNRRSDPGDYGEYGPWLFENGPARIRHVSNGNYELAYYEGVNGEELRLRLPGPQHDALTTFFQHLYIHRNDIDETRCSCNMDNIFEEEVRSPAMWHDELKLNKHRHRQNVDGGNSQDRFNIGQKLEFEICSYWSKISDEDSLIEAELHDGYFPADEWTCDENLCYPTLMDILDVEYRAFDVFGDNVDGCDNPKRHAIHGSNTIYKWGCDQTGCAEHHYNPGGGTTDHELTKCRHCRDYFGDACEYCHPIHGCADCVENPPAGFEFIQGGDPCTLAYCGLECCLETIIPEANLTLDPCNETDFTPIGGSGDVVYNCLEDADLSEPYQNGDFSLPAPHEEGGTCTFYDCKNDPYTEFCLGDEYCEIEGKYDGRGCTMCPCSRDSDPEYGTAACDGEPETFWYSDAMKCVNCHQHFPGCRYCRNADVTGGGGGCGQCEDEYEIGYDIYLQVFYCTLSNNPDDRPVSPDGWELECIEECSVRKGREDTCDCGCDCNTCDEDDVMAKELELNTDYHCGLCHYDSGCEYCDEGFFQLTRDYPCLNCTEVFGPRCLECNDWLGCSKCANGYYPTVSECCGFTYCEPQVTI